jgi:hypothetical protein
MKNKKIIRYILYFFSFLLVAFLALVAILYVIIFLEVRRTCDSAQARYQTNCIDALIKVLETDGPTVKQKNDAIWALGQIADPKALPALQKLYTGKIPEREPLDKVISQYEIKKAIHWVERGNWTSWMYFQFH